MLDSKALEKYIYDTPLSNLKSNVDFKIAKLVDNNLLNEGMKDFDSLTEGLNPSEIKEEQVFDREKFN